MTRSMLWVTVPLLLVFASLAELQCAAASPDPADKIGERLATLEFGPIGQPKLNRAWPIRYGLADAAKKHKEGWALAAGKAIFTSKCAACHGDDGSGLGPKAKELPQPPRDFRRGIFKFHESAVEPWIGKPSRHEIAETLRLGLPGTSMPAFDKLTVEQRDAVVEYVRWLAMRGEFAYNVAKLLRTDFDVPAEASAEELQDYVVSVRESLPETWKRDSSAKEVLPASDPPPMTEESIARGEALYQGNQFACHKCHAKDGRGVKFDDHFVDVWGKPQILIDLTKGIFKGGDGPHDLYWRIRDGITGTPHPNYDVFVVRESSDESIWDVVHYVYHLAGRKPDGARHARRRPPRDAEREEAPTDPIASEDEADKPLVAKGWGKVSGRILYGGSEVPQREVLRVVGGDAELVKGETILSPSLIINEGNKGLANVVIWIDLRQAGGLLPIHESLREPPAKEAKLVSRELQFQPHVVIARVGQPLLFRNENSVSENFRLHSGRNSGFNQTIAPGRDAIYQFRQKERLPLSLTSSVHPWTQSFVVAASHPYVAVTDETGAFAFDFVPAGTWQIRLWHEKIGTITSGSTERGALSTRDAKRFVTIGADEASDGEIVLDAKLFGH